MKRLLVLAVLLFCLLLVGCLQSGEQAKTTDPINMSVQVVESMPGSLLSIQLDGKTLSVNRNGFENVQNISFVEALRIASFLNDSFINSSFSFDKCDGCPTYEIVVRLQEKEKRIALSGQKLSGPALELVATLKGLAEIRECEADSDCVRGGCSGQACHAKTEGSQITTCEFRPEYSCYSEGGCGCIEGKCAWSGETLKCVEEKNKPPGEAPAETAQALCVMKCLEAKRLGTDLSRGPCISNAIAEGWVCDAVHSPKTAEDNEPQNVCPSLLGSKLKRIVEVTENCELTRVS
ncbi:eight-cysteine-cluster domain-containing protein [Candidatus Micrarchaeota archaeon]|nr:eight-cysteine-cluster domain-containing protein [Candidatus Micrarchaeota archaeon]